MPLPTMPTQPAQLLDPAEFKPFGKAARPKAGQEPRKPVPALEREALSETGRAQPKRSPAQARLGEASPMAKDDARQRPAVIAKAVDKVGATGKSTETAARRRARRDDGPTKLFVLDTNVLMHDPSSLFRFEEHDVYLPMMTLEELDNHKKGMSEVARNARAVSRTLDQLVAGTDGVMEDGLPLAKLGNRDAQGHLFFQTRLNDIKLPDGLPQGKADNQILGVVSALQQQRPDRHVVLVSKDINMRIKARALGLPAEDYFNDRVLEDTDLLYSGVMSLPADFWQKHGKNIESWQDPKVGTTFYRLSGPLVPSFLVNQFVFLEPNDGSLPLYAQVKELNGKTAVLQTLKDYTHQKNNVWGVTARNREQNFALNLLMHPEIDFVSLLGQAGTGKTLLALAAGLEQVLDQKLYNEIIITRATVPVGEDIGFLPGTEEEKMQPWMGAFDDNLEVLQKSDDNAGEWGRAATQELIRSRIKVKSMNFMRGRTFVNKFLIIDEAQNLTPKQMKTLVTRAGPGTKIVCLGNIAQIDTPYLTEGSSGLTYVVDRFKGWSHGGHITLARGERSRLADHASDVL
ncbi:PhoH family protein [Ralstonia pseudosolanacearum]|uniref:PhoH family protein n=1 Tax=Ralstonia pseudosolanacearum TaxID=1310165 RepID=UPI0007D73A3B|nr:PhoH family protein [Ralstonia pseudosolanacearum]MDC6293316.1 PhoH family protein [Ralstonia pseudosolanacearum]MDD7788557.1 PhoH family protein [Ralstonia pseudosolanacearum]MDN3366017.1 PhoH family protein [Ralstonia pseudosolanacearum]OAK92007.1 phosphate starvation protein PhoH [Ralstonia pseudosolanacearum]QOK86821.1 PhoH family protein [Ralstonia pseudosolanacearum]